MNKNAIAKLLCKHIRIYPPAESYCHEHRAFTPARDDTWFVEKVTKNNIILSNNTTRHRLNLGLDHVLEFRTPDTLILKTQIGLRGNNIYFKPLQQPPRVYVKHCP